MSWRVKWLNGVVDHEQKFIDGNEYPTLIEAFDALGSKVIGGWSDGFGIPIYNANNEQIAYLVRIK